MPTFIDMINVATQAYLRRKSTPLVDNLFAASPLVAHIRRIQRADAIMESTGCTQAEALASIDVVAAFPAGRDDTE